MLRCPLRHSNMTVVIRRLFLPLALVGFAASPSNTQAQDSGTRGRLTGRVTDAASGQPVANANVQVVGTSAVAVTGADGRYTITRAPLGVYSVEARRIGFGNMVAENIRLVADSVVVVNFALVTNPLRLTEMVVSATLDPTSGIKTPYTVDVVTSDNMPVPTTTSAAGALAGKVAGLTVVRASGAPGSGVYVQLRSPVSQFNSTSPLYVVDGVFLNSTQAVTTQDIESMDIASIEVIKGAAAASLYGSRAASGVISITTNRGKNLAIGQTQFTVRNEVGKDYTTKMIQSPLAHQFLVNAAGQYINADSVVVSRTERIVEPNGIMENAYIDPTFDHVKQFFRPGAFNTQTITMQQNSAATNFAIAYSRNQQPGTVPNSDGYLRQSIRFNIDHRLMDKIQVGLSVSHTRSKEDPEQISFTELARLNPDVDLLRPEPFGTSPYIIIPDSTYLVTNPLYRQLANDNKTERVRTLLNVNLSYRPISWLSFDGYGSYDRGDRMVNNYTPRGLTNLNGEGTTRGSLSYAQDAVDGIQAQGGATATKAFGDLTARLSFRGETQRESNPYFQSVGSDFTITGIKDLDLALTQTVTSSFTDRRATAAFGNLGLDYGGKYIADGLFRREGNSLFGPSHRWNSFYRASAAWIVSEEDWFPFRSLNLFKLRYNIGTAGTRPGFADQYDALGIDGNGAVTRQALGNPYLKPEVATEQEVGLDMIIKNRIQASFVYVSVDANDNLIGIPAPALSGFNTVESNVGRVTGNTIEATLQARILNNPKGLQWDALFIADKRRNFISEFNRTCYGDGILWRCEKTRLGTMWGNRLVTDKTHLRPEHVNSGAAFDVNDEGFVVPVGEGNTYRDGKAKSLWGSTVRVDGRSYAWGRPIIETDPLTDGRWFGQIGDGNPKLHYGLQNTLRYKGIRLYGQLEGQLGGQVYNQVAQSLYASADHPDVNQMGRPDELRKSTAYYSSGLADGNNGYLQNFVQDAGYIRLSEASIGYLFKASSFGFLNKIGADRLQVDLVGRNLFTATKYTGLNPQGGGATTRIDSIDYPLTRTFTLATSITF